MKRTGKSIVLISLLSIFAILCIYLFMENLILTVRYIKFFLAWGIFFDLRYLFVHALTTISILVALGFDIYYIGYIAKLVDLEKISNYLKEVRENKKQKQAEKKEKTRKTKIEKLQSQIDKLSNDREDESV